MKNIFDKAKESGINKKVEKHEVVQLPRLSKTLESIDSIDIKLAELEAKRELLYTEVREAGKEEMLKLYNKKHSFPGTLKIVAGERSYQFITSDKYLKIDHDRYNELKENYSSELVEEKTTYFFNDEMLEKYQAVISDMIQSSKKISTADKDKLIESTTNYTIKKGTLKNLFTLASNFKTSVNNLIDVVNPIFSVKIVK